MATRQENGMDVCSVLFLIFLVLKLAKVIDWSWWWVTSPMWIPIGVALVIFAIAIIISFFTRKK